MPKSRLWQASAFAAVLFAAVPAQAAEKVTLGELNWAGSKVLTQVLKTVIEDNYAVEVDVVPSSNAVIYESMDRGAGDIDVHTNVWMPAQGSFTKKYADDKKTVVLTPPIYDTMIGTCIPGYTQDQHGVKSVSDLTNPEVAKVFDSDGDGKGEWYPGPTGDQSTALERVKGREYGYNPFYTEINMDHDVFNGVLQSAVEKKQGVMFLCWQPHWIWKAFDLRVLQEPAFAPGCMDKMVYPADDPDWYQKSKVACANPPGHVHLAYSETLKKRAPDVAAFLERVKLDAKTVSDWIYDVSIGDKTPDATAYAKKWVADNPDVVKKWLGL